MIDILVKFNYRMKFPAKYKGGLEITKFEKNYFHKIQSEVEQGR